MSLASVASSAPPPQRPVQPAKTPKGPRRRPRFRLKWLWGLLILWLVFLIAIPLWAWSKVDKVDAFPEANRPDDQPGTTYLMVGSDSRGDLSAGDRVRHQYEYFGVTLDEVTRAGARAGDLVKGRLSRKPFVIQTTKRSVNRAWDVAGFRAALAANTELDVMIETANLPARDEFRRITAEEGLKAAIAWRDAKFRGDA